MIAHDLFDDVLIRRAWCFDAGTTSRTAPGAFAGKVSTTIAIYEVPPEETTFGETLGYRTGLESPEEAK
jgi:hypothetical protein